MLRTLLVWLVSYTACVLKKLKKAFDSDLSHLPPLVYGPLPSAASIRILDMIKPAAGDRNIIRLSTRIINLDSDLASLPDMWLCLIRGETQSRFESRCQIQ